MTSQLAPHVGSELLPLGTRSPSGPVSLPALGSQAQRALQSCKPPSILPAEIELTPDATQGPQGFGAGQVSTMGPSGCSIDPKRLLGLVA